MSMKRVNFTPNESQFAPCLAKAEVDNSIGVNDRSAAAGNHRPHTTLIKIEKEKRKKKTNENNNKMRFMNCER